MKVKIPIKISAATLIILLIVFVLGIVFGNKFISNLPFKTNIENKNTHQAFVEEIYDKVIENYWDNISNAQLLDLFKLAISQSGGSITVVKFDDKNQMLDTLDKEIKDFTPDRKNQFIVAVVSSVLSSLNPAGRSGLYTQQNEEQLKNTVSNINPEKDLYKDLGLSKEASSAAVEQAYQQQAATASAEKLQQLAYAKEVLTDKDKKGRYDQAGIEPTIFNKIIQPGILYVKFNKFSPTSLEEFVKVFDNYKNSELDSLIFDLRGNVGGAIDSTAYFLGYFLGGGQYAFDFYHKGEYLPFKTTTNKLPSLAKYKQIVVLIDSNTQSSAEMLAAALKKYHIGVTIGNPTKGWGTVERVFPLNNQIDKNQKYSLFLVHSITLRDDNLPIEGRGVDPDINIKDINWQTQLFSYFANDKLIQAVKEII